jgi:parallel beta-helix repeat protein
MKIIFNIALLVLITTRVFATNYYLSEKGNDAQNGTSPLTPWRTLKKLSTVLLSLQPGDSILFERGSDFDGQLKMSASGKSEKQIYVGAYGSGAKPIINGSIEIKEWKIFRGNIWVTDCINCSAEPIDLFIDGQYQSLGRYPNEGYMTLSCNSDCKKMLTDNQHIFADGYWDGSEVVVKSSRWTLDNLPVTNYFNKTFYFSSAPSYPLPTGYGYFIQKHLATLDKQGEWFFDKSSKKLFLFCANGDNPNHHTIESSMENVGLELMLSNFVAIENIAFLYQNQLGVQIKYSNNISLRHCEVRYAGNNGMEITSCQNQLIENCRIEDSNNNGVEWNDNKNGSFLRNFIFRTGLHPGRGNSGNGTYIGLNITANNIHTTKNIFQYNSIDSTGYLGIDFRTGGTTIKNNIVDNFCMIKDDGAGIYTWGNAYGDNTIEGNFVLHGIGCAEGTNDVDQVWVSGIYIDDRSADLNIKNNTVAYCGTNGIYIHNAKQLRIEGNTLFANGNPDGNKENAQLCIKRDALVPSNEGEALELHIIENRFVTLNEDNPCIYLNAEKEEDLSALGLIDKNLFIAPRANMVIAQLFNHPGVCNAVEEFSLSEWQRSGNDKNSQFKLIRGSSTESAGPNLIRNGRMASNIEGWMVWPSQISIAHDKRVGEDAPSLKVQFSGGKHDALLYYAGFSLNKDKWYRLSFSALSSKKSKIEFVPMMASSPWEALDDYTCFSVDTVFKSFTYLFKPNKSNKIARVNFKSNGTYWIDNVRLSEIGFQPGGIKYIQLFYNASENTKNIFLKEKFTDLDGNQIPDTIELPGYSSTILQRN